MFILISTISIIALGICTGCYFSKRKFERSINEFFNKAEIIPVETSELEDEFDRIEELKVNLEEVRINVENLDMPHQSMSLLMMTRNQSLINFQAILKTIHWLLLVRNK